LAAGGPFAGGTLARDVVTLTQLGQAHHEALQLIPAIKQSNDRHRGWAFRKLQSRLGNLDGKTIAVLGLVYTPNTNTLRRSAAVELCRQLGAASARVRAFDPAVKSSPAELTGLTLASSLAEAVTSADAVVVCTEWPEFRDAPWAELLRTMRQPAVIVDANRFLDRELGGLPGMEHLSVGHS
jgi:UDPglucose 6-dehydrogenase